MDDMVMDEQEGAEEGAREDGKGRHCPPADDDGKGGIDGQGGVDGQGGLGRQGTYERWGPHRDEAYPAEGGGDGQDAPAPSGDDPRGPQDSQDPQDPGIVG
ncbi:hypothetical protein ABZX93_23000 [Streptomyces sp. NPDC006632]|uniref:hypothetical protein n=1 Tax=Streptomyces sp. NPDC006632 TaxID=3157182 RepID=UPI0033BE2966